MSHVYLGDSVYLKKDEHKRLVIYLDNGIGEHSHIVLEKEVAICLLNILKINIYET